LFQEQLWLDQTMPFPSYADVLGCPELAQDNCHPKYDWNPVRGVHTKNGLFSSDVITTKN
jgi:hypothetical protein